MNQQAPLNPSAPTVPPRRFGRTALVVHLLSLLAAGMMFLIAYFQHDLTDRNVFSAFGMAMGGVGLLWSIVLAVRARLNKEPLLLLLLIPLLVGWELSIPLALLWLDPKRGYKKNWYEVHYVCAPLIVPLLTLSATAAVLLFLLLRRRFLMKSCESSPATRSAGKIAALSATLFFFATLPFGFVLYGGSMARQIWTEPRADVFWTVEAVNKVPVFVRDGAFRFSTILPKSLGLEISWALAERGYLSAELYKSILRTKDTDDSLGLRQNLARGYAKAHLHDLLQQARASLHSRSNFTVWDEMLAMQYALNAPIEEILDLFKQRSGQPADSDLLRHKVLISLYFRRDTSRLAESIAAMRDTEPALLRWRVMMLMDINKSEYLRDAYADFIQSNSPVRIYLTVTRDLLRKRKWPAIQAALEHASKDVRKNVRIALVSCFWADKNQSFDEVLLLKVNQAAFQKMLNAQERDEAVATAILIFAMLDEDTAALRAKYGHLPNSSQAELDWIKIRTDSAQNKNELVEKAWALLISGRSR